MRILHPVNGLQRFPALCSIRGSTPYGDSQKEDDALQAMCGLVHEIPLGRSIKVAGKKRVKGFYLMTPNWRSFLLFRGLFGRFARVN
jgi:hypothetical protein